MKIPLLDAAINTEYLDEKWLDSNGIVKLLPAAEFRSVSKIHFMLWCYRHGRYLIPTVELIDFIKKEIGYRTAIELASGNADFGYHLGIQSTDSFIQQDPIIAAFYKLTGQSPTAPPSYVEKLDAIDALTKYMPKVAVAAWMTRKFIEGTDVNGKSQASIYGVQEERILDTVEMYIHVGNKTQHDEKTILRFPHRAIHIDGMVSRSQSPEDDIIYIWET